MQTPQKPSFKVLSKATPLSQVNPNCRVITWDLQYFSLQENNQDIETWRYGVQEGNEIGLVMNNQVVRFSNNGFFLGSRAISLIKGKPVPEGEANYSKEVHLLNEQPEALYFQIDTDCSGGISVNELEMFTSKMTPGETKSHQRKIIESQFNSFSDRQLTNEDINNAEITYYDFLHLWPQLVQKPTDVDNISTNLTVEELSRPSFDKPSRYELLRVRNDFIRLKFSIDNLGVWGLKLHVREAQPSSQEWVVEVELSTSASITGASRHLVRQQADSHLQSGFVVSERRELGVLSSKASEADRLVLYETKRRRFQKNMVIPRKLLNGDRINPKEIIAAINQMNQGLIGRDEVCHLAVLATLAGEHLFLYGPPGTGKSMVAQRLTNICSGNVKYCERLLSTFSTPEDLFGPISLKTLKETDTYRRKIDGYLPSVHFAFIDEVFKANKGVLNALLTILNERLFDDGPDRLRVPLRTALSASNEVPTTSDMRALFDRFLLRGLVDRVSDENFSKLLVVTHQDESFKEIVRFRLVDLSLVEILAKETFKFKELSSQVTNFILKMKRKISEIEEKTAKMEGGMKQQQGGSKAVEGGGLVSDRRWVKLGHLLKVLAYSNGRDSIKLIDCFMLIYACWEVRHQFEELKSWVIRELRREFTDGKFAKEESSYVKDNIWITPEIRQQLQTLMTPQEIAEMDNEGNSQKQEEEMKKRKAALESEAEEFRKRKERDEIEMKAAQIEMEKQRYAMELESKKKIQEAEHIKALQRAEEDERKAIADKTAAEKARLAGIRENERVNAEAEKVRLQTIEKNALELQARKQKIENSKELLVTLKSNLPEEQKKQRVQELLNAKADPNYKEPNFDDTPLTYVCFQGMYSILEIILAYGDVQLDAKDSYGDSALNQVIKYVKNFDTAEKMCFLLLGQKDVSKFVNLQNNQGNTALHLILKRSSNNPKRIVENLLSAGASKTIRNNAGQTPRDCIQSDSFISWYDRNC